MRKSKQIRKNNRMASDGKNFFQELKPQIIISIIFAIIGVVFGAVIITTNASNIELENIFDKNLFAVLNSGRNFFAIFLWYTIYFLITVLIIYFSCHNKNWQTIFPLLVLMISGFVIGYNVSIIIILFGFIGFLNAIIIIILFDIIILICTVLITAISLKKCKIRSKYGCDYFKQNCKSKYINIIKILLSIAIMAILIKSILMPIMRITIIV